MNQDRFDLVSHNAVSIAEGVRRVKVFSLCFHTGCMTGRLKVLTLSVLRAKEKYKRGDTTKTSGNAQSPGKATISIVGSPW